MSFIIKQKCNWDNIVPQDALKPCTLSSKVVVWKVNTSAQSKSNAFFSFFFCWSIHFCTPVCAGCVFMQVEPNMFFMKTIFFPREKNRALYFLHPTENTNEKKERRKFMKSRSNLEKKRRGCVLLVGGKRQRCCTFLSFVCFQHSTILLIWFRSRSFS